MGELPVDHSTHSGFRRILWGTITSEEQEILGYVQVILNAAVGAVATVNLFRDGVTDITDLVFKLVLIGTCIGSAWIGYDPTPQKHDSGWRAARLFGGINALLASVILGKLLFGVAFGYAHQQQVQSLMFFVQYAAHGVWYALNMWAYWRIMKKVS